MNNGITGIRNQQVGAIDPCPDADTTVNPPSEWGNHTIDGYLFDLDFGRMRRPADCSTVILDNGSTPGGAQITFHNITLTGNKTISFDWDIAQLTNNCSPDWGVYYQLIGIDPVFIQLHNSCTTGNTSGTVSRALTIGQSFDLMIRTATGLSSGFGDYVLTVQNFDLQV